MSDQTFWKATRPDGTDFYSGTIDYAAALTSGQPVTIHEADDPRCCTGTVLHASTAPTETLIGGSWPCRLFEVTGTPVAKEGRKRGFFSLTVIREVDAHLAFGPQGERVAALIDHAGRLDRREAESLWSARDAARAAARGAARYAAGDAAWAAAGALVMRDLIGQRNFTQEHYDLLTRPWRTVIGPIHPDDKELKGQDDE
ncbi:hypothetical protein M3B11_02765 [Brevibacterium sp. p3-SID960]|uniref:hypothetical protein n=1 Tax=Brevibacterium sp. p3-SID960 TaxID=2916063 RepID=UPI0021A726C4|nr:hypothetical protein [Brevibacterium sp. p3-SID960]MCT1689890.1 hypothetical protein [Brevibacterium sp. p3-SID960]